MTDEERGPRDDAPDGDAEGEESDEGRRKGFADGIRHGLGILSAFKEAMEETIQEAKDRGDLSSDRAKEVLHGAVGRAKRAAGGARERFDFATQQELDALRVQVESLKARVKDLTGEEADERKDEDGHGRKGGE